MYREGHRANICLVDAIFFYSDAFAFIEDLDNQINTIVFNRNSYNYLGKIKLFLTTRNVSEIF